MRVRVECYTKKLQTQYNKGVQANCKVKGGKITKSTLFITYKVDVFYRIVFTLKYRLKINIKVV